LTIRVQDASINQICNNPFKTAVNSIKIFKLEFKTQLQKKMEVPMQLKAILLIVKEAPQMA
jgi:hypothetical protein